MSYRTPLGRVRGLGSAKEGVAHWWAQRLTALALIPLTLWFVISVVQMIGADRPQVVEWIGSPVTAILLIVLIGATFHHAQLGVQVVIEDYVHTGWLKWSLILFVKAAAILLALIAIFAILKIALTPGIAG
jgi:succinate dehydrogenase / fumarate reductase membrane anchor subunit